MADISKIKLPSGTTYDIKDSVARETKIDKPSTEGTSGQVLSTDGNGGTAWADQPDVITGIHVGETAPTDPNVQVWLQPDGESDVVGIEAEATQLPAGSSPTAEFDATGDVLTLQLGLPAPEKGDRGDTVIIATKYEDLTFPVAEGTYCLYNNLPYVANQAIATSEAWTAAHWDQVSFEDEIGELKNAIDYLGDNDYNLRKKVFNTMSINAQFGDYNGTTIVSSTTKGYFYGMTTGISTVKIKEGYVYSVGVKAAPMPGNFSQLTTGWSTDDVDLTSNQSKYLLILGKKSDNSTLSESDLQDMFTFVTIDNLEDGVSENSTKIADTNDAFMANARQKYNANFNLDCVSENDDGVYLKQSTGNTDHNNILWVKDEENKSVALFESVCKIPNILNNPYARFFVSGQNKSNYFYLPITFTSTGEIVEVYRWADNSLKARTVSITGTVIVNDFDNIKIKLLYDNGGLFVYINDVLACFTDVVQVGANPQIGIAWNNANVAVYHKIRFKETPEKYVHISVDDVRNCLKDITDNSATYTSIFQNSFFAKLKDWRNEYGAVFTLNVFNYFDDSSQVELLANVPAKYKDEFVDVSEWIKFAVHSPGTTDYYADYTDADVVTTYTAMINEILRFAGVQSVDQITRFGYFSINKSAITALKSAGAYFMGCLTSDDNRSSDCGLDATERSIVQTYGEYYDFLHNVVYIKSVPRLDDYTVVQNVATFKSRCSHLKWSRYLEIFFHEGSASGAYEDIEALLPIVRKFGLRFDYGMNNNLL